MGQADNAIAAYKKVREKYPTSPQAEQATFWIAQMNAGGGGAKTAVNDFNSFIQKYPQSDLLPSAMYFKAKAQASMNDPRGRHAVIPRAHREVSQLRAVHRCFLRYRWTLAR
jgi:TolA-binding protein